MWDFCLWGTDVSLIYFLARVGVNWDHTFLLIFKGPFSMGIKTVHNHHLSASPPPLLGKSSEKKFRCSWVGSVKIQHDFVLSYCLMQLVVVPAEHNLKAVSRSQRQTLAENSQTSIHLTNINNQTKTFNNPNCEVFFICLAFLCQWTVFSLPSSCWRYGEWLFFCLLMLFVSVASGMLLL